MSAVKSIKQALIEAVAHAKGKQTGVKIKLPWYAITVKGKRGCQRSRYLIDSV